MRIFFFVILLCNIIFFLWEFNSRPINAPIDMAESTGKQILLLSELPKKETEESPVVINNERKLEVADEILSGFEADGFKPRHKKFVLDESVEILTMNFDGFKIVSDSVDDSDKYITDFLKSLEMETQNNAKLGPELNLEQKDIKKTGQDKGLPEENAEIKQDLETEQRICYQVGPFLEEKNIIAWIKLNNLDEDAVTRFNKELKIVSNYLVYYPRAETYALSKKNVQIFKQKGIRDFWLFRKGELKGIFSLGLLKKEERALWLQKELAKKGLNAEVMPRYKTQSAWYAKILSKEIMTNETIAISEKQSLLLCGNI